MYQVQKSRRDYSPPGSGRSGAHTGRRKRTTLTVEKFENYPEIENTTLICNLLADMLQVDEKKRATAHQIQQKYHTWL